MKFKEFLKKIYKKIIKRAIIALLIIAVVAGLIILASSNDPQNMVVNKIKFEQDSFTCSEGKTITTNISGEVSNANVFSQQSDIADVKKNDIEIPKCGNCMVIDIICKKEGNVNIEANALNGNKAITIVTVTK